MDKAFYQGHVCSLPGYDGPTGYMRDGKVATSQSYRPARAVASAKLLVAKVRWFDQQVSENLRIAIRCFVAAWVVMFGVPFCLGAADKEWLPAEFGLFYVVINGVISAFGYGITVLNYLAMKAVQPGKRSV